MRAGAHDPATEDGRSLERYRRALLSTGANFVARLLNVVTLFVSIRIVADRTSAQGLGLWLLLVTAVALVGFADLGIGNSLLSLVSNALGRDDHDVTRQIISSALVALTLLAIGLGVAFAVVYPHVSWARVFNVTGPEADEAGPATVAFVACMLASLPLGLAQRVNHAYQRGWIANLWAAIGSVISLVAVLVLANAGAGVAALVAAMLAGPPVAYFVDSVVLFLVSRRDLRPRLRHVTTAAARLVLGRGLLFFVLATVVAVSYESDTLVISHFLGADEVENYAAPFRLFALAPSAAAILLSPLWPAYGEAVARNDLLWVHRTLRRSVALGFVVTAIPSMLLIPLAPPLISAWVGHRIQSPVILLAGIGTWAVLNGVSTALAMFSNGAGTLRLQVKIAVAMGVSNLGLSIAFVQWFGLPGPIWATVVTQVVFGFVPAWFMMRRLFARDSTADDFRRYLDRWSDLKASERAAVVK